MASASHFMPRVMSPALASALAVSLFLPAVCLPIGPVSPSGSTTAREHRSPRFEAKYAIEAGHRATLTPRRTFRYRRYRTFAGALEIPPEADDEGRRITFEYRSARERGPAVAILPVLRGKYRLSHHLARWLAGKGISTVLVHRSEEWLEPNRPVDELESLIVETVRDQRRVLAWLRGRPEIDPDRIGVMGFCMGGSNAAIIGALEPDLAALVIVMGVGDIGGVLATSKLSAIADYRESRLQATGLSPADWESRARTVLSSDPVLLVDPSLADRALFVMVTEDRHIPARHQEVLWAGMGRPDRMVVASGHYRLLLHIFRVKKRTLNFLRGKCN